MAIFNNLDIETASVASLAKELLAEMQTDPRLPECYHEDISVILEKYEAEKQRRNEKAKARRTEKSDKNFEEYKNLLDSCTESIISAKGLSNIANVSTQKASAILRTLVSHELLTKEYTKDGVVYHRVETPTA